MGMVARGVGLGALPRTQGHTRCTVTCSQIMTTGHVLAELTTRGAEALLRMTVRVCAYTLHQSPHGMSVRQALLCLHFQMRELMPREGTQQGLVEEAGLGDG